MFGCLLCCACCSCGTGCKENIVNNSKWMQNIDDNQLINMIAIPGTHDSCAISGSRYRSFKLLTLGCIPFVACQKMTVDEQLRSGIRFLDLRCTVVNNTFYMQHGIIGVNTKFEGVMETMTHFLTTNPSEVILIRIGQEKPPQDNSTKTFAEVFYDYYTNYKNYFYDGNGEILPAIKELRGKIFVMRDFDLTGNQDVITALSNLQVYSSNIAQPDWNYSPTRVHEIYTLFTQSTQPHDNKFILNYFSMVGVPDPTTTGWWQPTYWWNYWHYPPVETSKLTNSIIFEIKPPQYAVCIFDFPTQQEINECINLNNFPVVQILPIH